MARLLPEQLEFDFFAPPTEQAKKPEKRAVSAAFKDADILKFQLNKDGSRKLEDFGEDLNNTRKGRSVHKKGDPYQFLTASQDEIEERLATESLDRVWPKEAVFDLHKQNPKAAALDCKSFIKRTEAPEKLKQVRALQVHCFDRYCPASSGCNRRTCT
mgnify:CR=1 FL=1